MQGPVNYISLHCVKPSMRPLSMAMSTVSIHIFGDVPSSPLVGVLQVCFLSSLHNLRLALSGITKYWNLTPLLIHFRIIWTTGGKHLLSSQLSYFLLLEFGLLVINLWRDQLLFLPSLFVFMYLNRQNWMDSSIVLLFLYMNVRYIPP